MSAQCSNCGSKSLNKNGRDKDGNQKYHCKDCGKHFVEGFTSRTSVQSPIKEVKKNLNDKYGLTEKELRERYDVHFIITESCKKLEKGIFLQDSEFIQIAGVRAIPGYRQILDHPDFSGYRGKAKGNIVYWSHPDSIMRMKEEGILM